MTSQKQKKITENIVILWIYYVYKQANTQTFDWHLSFKKQNNVHWSETEVYMCIILSGYSSLQY